MRAVVVGLLACLLLPAGAAEARPRDPIVYEDPDDTDGPFDVKSVTRTDVRFFGGLHYQHRIEFHELWLDGEPLAGGFFLHERDFRRPRLCDTDTCTGTWVGEIYTDDRGNVQAYMEEVSNCNDCNWSFQVPVWEHDGGLTLLVPRELLYDGPHSYTMQVWTEFSNLLRVNTSPECRAETCEDFAADEETAMRFPVGR